MSIGDRISATIVQQRMNEVVGTMHWSPHNEQWSNLLRARNAFIKHRIKQAGYSIPEFKALAKPQRRYQIARLQFAFSAEFFRFSRDGSWMQKAVTENEGWIHVPGMREWHVRASLRALEHSKWTVRATQTPLEEGCSVARSENV